MRYTGKPNVLAGITLLLLTVCQSAAADWQTVTDPGLSLKTGRGLYIFQTHTFDSTVSVTNNTGAALVDDYRVVIDSSNKPPTGADTFDDGCVNCFALPAAKGLGQGKTTSRLIHFSRGRGRLIYEAHLEQFQAAPEPAPSVEPRITFDAPAASTVTRNTPITVSGTVESANGELTIDGTAVPVSDGKFAADIPLHEGDNRIVASVMNDQDKTATAAIIVVLDTTAPTVTTEYPRDGQTTVVDHINVSGMVNDVVVGTVSAEDCTVSVNGITAAVENRGFQADGILLKPGANTLNIRAVDAAGNMAEKVIDITYDPPAPNSAVIQASGGQQQSGQILETLPEGLEVRLTDSDGKPATGVQVIFRVTQGDGLLGYTDTLIDPSERAIAVRTDADGTARARYALGGRAGAGANRVRASAIGYSGQVVFLPKAHANRGDRINVVAGNSQRGAVSQPLPLPLVAAVIDNGNNLIEGARVRFEVQGGGATFADGSTAIDTTTDNNGRASAHVILGPNPGYDNQRILATLVDTDELIPVTSSFTLSGLETGPAADTRISGTVLNGQDQPLQGVTISLKDAKGNPFYETAITDDQGQFQLTGVPVGPVELRADGSTAAATTGRWPSIGFNLVTVSGADNTLPAPIYLPLIDTDSGQIVGAEDTVYTNPKIPGFAIRVKAGSATFPDGSKTGSLSVTPINVNKVPMVPPNGIQPQLITTIQPHGTTFDPPAQLTVPNTDGYAAGTQIEMYTWDHDLNEFIVTAVGSVSEDGAVITSNPGQGVVKAGWTPIAPATPGQKGCAHRCPVCQAPGPGCAFCVFDDSIAPDDDCKVCKDGGVTAVTFTHVEAKVEGEDEKWKLLNTDGTATFSFTGNAESADCNKPVYTWDYGDGQTGEGLDTSHTYATNGEYEVTFSVQCGECPQKYEDIVSAVALKLTHETLATVPADRGRLSLGINEEVVLEVDPKKPVRWRVTPGGLINGGDEVGKATLLADDYESSPTVTISNTDNETLGDIEFNVVEPQGVIFEKLYELPNSQFGFGFAGVGMELNVTVQPVGVSFRGILIKEVAGPGEGVEGYFTKVGLTEVAHLPNPNWVRLDENNGFTDTAAYFGRPNNPQWEDGRFHWNIPMRFATSSGESSGMPFPNTVLQSFHIYGPPNEGQMSVTKQTETATRGPFDEDI